MPTHYSLAVLPSAILGQEDVIGKQSQRGEGIEVILAVGQLLCEIGPLVVDGDRGIHTDEVE